MGKYHTHRRNRTLGALTLAGILALSACGGDSDDSETSSNEESAFDVSEPARDPAEGGFIGSSDDAAEDVSSDGGEPGRDFDIGVIGRDVIIEMHVVVSSDNIQRTVSSIMANASNLGGGVSSSDVNYGNRTELDGDQGYAVLVVKVPPEAVDRLLAGLDDTGTVQSINQSAQDVTEQLVDLEVRIRNARESVANVREFMERAEDLNDLVTLEGELTRRQTELERLEAQQRNISDRVALSTVTIEVVPTASVPVIEETDDSIGGAFSTGWEAFVGVLFGLIYVLAVLAPFLVLAAIALVIARQVRRRRQTAANVETRPLEAPTVASDQATSDTINDAPSVGASPEG